MSVVEATSAAAPSRCESPLLPMGQHQTDPDRLQQQAGRASHRQSQQSVLLRKTYAIPDDRDAEPPAVAAAAATVDGRRTRARHYILRPHRLPRPAVHRLALPARDLSSRLKSACRRLDPRRLGAPAANPPLQPPRPASDASSAEGPGRARSL
ncbi:hypothetical protein IWQ57_000977 [Coemansia nantahalensis]|uniref:Uncharacterized protein n=1 Tax=Coemansia nantahalensis TaxID=2789366 RepID=A0ACC1K601_9FUNG|nr:hypothetical protein IWQ57_000977 [Coemansia nantahalensis]